MPVTDPATEQPRFADYAVEVSIDAATEVVWEALTSDIGRWWPRVFYCGAGSAEDARGEFHLEAHPGGRMWEDWGNGDGLVWGHVTNVVQGKSIDLTHVMSPAFGGPTTWYGTFSLEADGSSTKVRLAESGFGRVSEADLGDKTKGWEFLFANLKAHVEGTEPVEWE